jgi:uncharacterized membrane protein
MRGRVVCSLYDLMRTPIERAVRDKLDGLTPHASALHVSSENESIILTGDVLTDERALLVREAAAVEGVDSVIDLLDEHREPDGIPALTQRGPQLPTVPRVRSMLARSAHPALRVAAAGAGLGAMATGLRVRGTAGVSLGIVGGLLFAAGLGGASGAGAVADATRLRRVIELDAAVVVEAAAEDVFATFRALHHAPRFLRHVRAVERRGANRYRWSMDGASGSPVSWDVEIASLLINRRLSWKSVRGARVRMTGDARFQRLAPDTTRVLLHLTYALPFGRDGRAIRALFGNDPDVQLAEDLQRFEEIVEAGGPPDSYRPPAGSSSR